MFVLIWCQSYGDYYNVITYLLLNSSRHLQSLDALCLYMSKVESIFSNVLQDSTFESICFGVFENHYAIHTATIMSLKFFRALIYRNMSWSYAKEKFSKTVDSLTTKGHWVNLRPELPYFRQLWSTILICSLKIDGYDIQQIYQHKERDNKVIT